MLCKHTIFDDTEKKNTMAENMTYIVPTMAELSAAGKEPEILFWVGCAGSFDDRYKKVTIAFAKILNKIGIHFAVLGTE